MTSKSGQPSNPPVPVLAQLTRAGTILRVEFDRLLEPGPLNTRNWRGVADFREFIMDFMLAADSSAIGRPIFGVPSPLTPRVTYTPPPFDVRSLAGFPGAPFQNVPIDVFP